MTRIDKYEANKNRADAQTMTSQKGVGKDIIPSMGDNSVQTKAPLIQ